MLDSPPSDNLVIRAAASSDRAAIADLHAQVFGPGRFARTAYRIREQGNSPAAHCFVAEGPQGITGAIEFTPVTIGGNGDQHNGAWLLGPIAIATAHTGKGVGRKLIGRGIDYVAEAGGKLIILVGDLSYYGKFGFAPVEPGRITLPGPVDPDRILGLALNASGGSDSQGLVRGSSV